jgi:hypothetical protein
MHDYILNITLAKGSGEYCICEWCLSLLSLAGSNLIDVSSIQRTFLHHACMHVCLLWIASRRSRFRSRSSVGVPPSLLATRWLTSYYRRRARLDGPRGRS